LFGFSSPWTMRPARVVPCSVEKGPEILLARQISAT
jgi:hypothetical protein